MMALGSLLTGGVFERFAGLEAAFLEGSCSWVPWWLWSLDAIPSMGDDNIVISTDWPPHEPR